MKRYTLPLLCVVLMLAGCEVDYEISRADVENMQTACEVNGGPARYYFQEPTNVKQQYSSPSAIRCNNNAEKDFESPMRDVTVSNIDLAQFEGKCDANGGIKSYGIDDVGGYPDLISRVGCANDVYFDWIRTNSEDLLVDVDKEFKE